MTMDLFRYDGKRVVVVGGATGMGASTAAMAADLGAEVVVLDVAPVEYDCAQKLSVDLRDRASVDEAVDELMSREGYSFYKRSIGVVNGLEGDGKVALTDDGTEWYFTAEKSVNSAQ